MQGNFSFLKKSVLCIEFDNLRESKNSVRCQSDFSHMSEFVSFQDQGGNFVSLERSQF